MSYKLFVDLDGVMANWHQSACDFFGVPYPSNTILYRGWLCEQTGRPTHELLTAMDSRPGFWEDMLTLPVVPDLVSYLDTTFPDWKILTKATHGPSSWSGKAAWVKRYFGDQGMSRLYICGGPKSVLASPYSILVDDTDSQVQTWSRAGGLAFRWREYTSDCVAAHREQLSELVQFLEPYKPKIKS